MDPGKLRALAIEREQSRIPAQFSRHWGPRQSRLARRFSKAVRQSQWPPRIDATASSTPRSSPPKISRAFAQLHVIAFHAALASKLRTCAGPNPASAPNASRAPMPGAALEKSGAQPGLRQPIIPSRSSSPFRGLYACVTRQLPDGTPAGGWQPQERISLEDCIRAYTTGFGLRGICGREEG